MLRNWVVIIDKDVTNLRTKVVMSLRTTPLIADISVNISDFPVEQMLFVSLKTF
jgi:hypothetical protein